jgi:transcriptional regulator with XRE-family HTH domain
VKAETKVALSELQPTPRIPVWTLGERMKKARKDRGLNATEMAEALRDALAHLPKFKCKDGNTISAWETDAREPELLIPTLRAWAQICDVDEGWLITGGVHSPLYEDFPFSVHKGHEGFVNRSLPGFGPELSVVPK